ncbi:MAG: hypothetical protein LC798_09915 [Chloroflexi bacterium]|nr:hypothetical protein [Chloroflexota bacterium]
MTSFRLALLRQREAVSAMLGASLMLGACSSADPSPTPSAAASPSAEASQSSSPASTPTPTPSPSPTPRFTNEPDDELAGLIPETVAGVPVVVAPFDEFALTPGDIGTAYGEIGDRFASLVLAAGTQVYTWSSGEYVFLLIGVDDAVNRALVEALPGQPAPSPAPSPPGPRSESPSAEPSSSPAG